MFISFLTLFIKTNDGTKKGFKIPILLPESSLDSLTHSGSHWRTSAARNSRSVPFSLLKDVDQESTVHYIFVNTQGGARVLNKEMSDTDLRSHILIRYGNKR